MIAPQHRSLAGCPDRVIVQPNKEAHMMRLCHYGDSLGGDYAFPQPAISRPNYADITIAVPANDKILRRLRAQVATAHTRARESTETLLLSCHFARSHSSGLSFMGYRGGAHLGYDDEWHVP